MAENVLKAGTVALVTGASAGIGEAVAEALVARGLHVVGVARGAERLEAVAARLGPRFHALVLDVGDGAAVDGLIERLPAPLRSIDILVNNAGHDEGGRRRFDEGSADEWARIIETNVIGAIRVARAVAPGMAARRRGHIVNMGSIAGLRAYPGGSVYAASKFALHGLSQGLREDFAPLGVRVSEIMPGLVRTRFAYRRWAGAPEKADAFYDEAAAVLAADDVARAVIFALEQPPHVLISQLVVEPAPA